MVACAVVGGVLNQALSLAWPPVFWAGCWGPLSTCCGRGCAGVGAQHCFFGLHALWEAACRGGGGGPSPGGVAFHCCEGRPASGAVPPPAARPLGRASEFRDPCIPGAVGVGVGTWHRPYSVRPCDPLLRAVGVAQGRPRGGCLSPL